MLKGREWKSASPVPLSYLTELPRRHDSVSYREVLRIVTNSDRCRFWRGFSPIRSQSIVVGRGLPVGTKLGTVVLLTRCRWAAVRKLECPCGALAAETSAC